MSDPNVESTTLEGAGENQPSVSQRKESSIAGSSPSSQELLEIKKALELTQKELKGLQSRQDKDKNETQRFMDEIKTHVAKGLSLDEAEKAVHADREVRKKDELLFKIASKLGIDDSLQAPTGNGSNATDEATEVFEEYGVDPNDPEASSLLNLQGVDLVKAVSKLAIKKSKSSIIDSSEATSLSGSPAKNNTTVDELTQQYQKDILATPRGKAGDSIRRQIKEKAKKNGVPVDSIAFV